MAARNTPCFWLASWAPRPTDAQPLSFILGALESLQTGTTESPGSQGTPANAERAPELPFYPRPNCQRGQRSGEKGWGAGYVALHTNPTVVDTARNYPHGPLWQRELHRGDGEEC